MMFLTQSQINEAKQGKQWAMTQWQRDHFNQILLQAFLLRLQSNPRCTGWFLTDQGDLKPFHKTFPKDIEIWRGCNAAWARDYLRILGLIPPDTYVAVEGCGACPKPSCIGPFRRLYASLVSNKLCENGKNIGLYG